MPEENDTKSFVIHINLGRFSMRIMSIHGNNVEINTVFIAVKRLPKQNLVNIQSFTQKTTHFMLLPTKHWPI
jgi:hypothetical protein